MAVHTLCEGPPLDVSISGKGDRTLVVVTDSVAVRFWASTSDLEDLLRGGSAQFSALEGFCKFDVRGGAVSVEFQVHGGPRKTCRFDAGDLERALEAVRQDAERDLPSNGETIVEG